MTKQNTTIKLTKKTKERLEGIKEYKRETYDELINKLLNIVNITVKNPVQGARILRNIKKKKSGKQMVYQDKPNTHSQIPRTSQSRQPNQQRPRAS